MISDAVLDGDLDADVVAFLFVYAGALRQAQTNETPYLTIMVACAC